MNGRNEHPYFGVTPNELVERLNTHDESLQATFDVLQGFNALTNIYDECHQLTDRTLHLFQRLNDDHEERLLALEALLSEVLAQRDGDRP